MKTCILCGKMNNIFQGDPLEFNDETMLCYKCSKEIKDDINNLW